VVVGNGINQPGNQNVKGIEDLLNHLERSIDTLKTPGASANDPAVVWCPATP